VVRRNRPAAPALFLHELAASFEIIGQAPHIGRSYRQSAVSGVCCSRERGITSTTSQRLSKSGCLPSGTRNVASGRRCADNQASNQRLRAGSYSTAAMTT
jgi:hypothetical protein